MRRLKKFGIGLVMFMAVAAFSLEAANIVFAPRSVGTIVKSKVVARQVASMVKAQYAGKRFNGPPADCIDHVVERFGLYATCEITRVAEGSGGRLAGTYRYFAEIKIFDRREAAEDRIGRLVSTKLRESIAMAPDGTPYDGPEQKSTGYIYAWSEPVLERSQVLAYGVRP